MRKNAIRFMLNEYPDVMSIDEMCRALKPLQAQNWNCRFFSVHFMACVEVKSLA